MRKYIFIVAILLFALPAMSQNTFHVNTGSDSGVGSLRNAINSSNSGLAILYFNAIPLPAMVVHFTGQHPA